jgi:hypothetical protein
MHLWADGLEPTANFVDAWRSEDQRVAQGWAPFWHYRCLGRYGEQLADLLSLVDRDRVLVLRYWQLVSQPRETLNRVSRFLGLAENAINTVPPDNFFRRFVMSGPRRTLLSRVIRTGAATGRFLPPEVWRRASRPLLAAMALGGPVNRPQLSPEQRTVLLEDCLDDIATLEEVLRESFADWRSPTGRGSFVERTSRGGG